MSILHEIFSHKKTEIAIRQLKVPASQLNARLETMPLPPNFSVALINPAYRNPRLIAEVKHKSPSKGVLRKKFNPLSLAKAYVENGAQAISVLTDEKYFGGNMAYLNEIHLQHPAMPLLCKDFIYSRYQLLEARVNGASAALLIVAMLSEDDLKSLIAYAMDIAITPLVEVHDELEMQQAILAGAKVIGINNRNLNDFTVDLNTTFRLVKERQEHENIIFVSESGIASSENVDQLEKAGVDAMLIGESIVISDDVGAAVQQFSRSTVEKAAL